MTEANKPDGGFAFPRPMQPGGYSTSPGGTGVVSWPTNPGSSGMTLRDYFAGQALLALGEMNPNLPGEDAASTSEWPEAVELAKRKARWSYLLADAMLAERATP